MTQQNEASRMAFEEWIPTLNRFGSFYEYPLAFAKNEDGTYMNNEIRKTYQGWQASESRTAALLAEKDAEIERLKTENADRIPADEFNKKLMLKIEQNLADNQRLQQQVDVLRTHMETLALGDDLTAKYAAMTLAAADKINGGA
jgi:hypothetical protein